MEVFDRWCEDALERKWFDVIYDAHHAQIFERTGEAVKYFSVCFLHFPDVSNENNMIPRYFIIL